MRRVNFRFLLAVIACLLVIAGAVHAVHVLQYDKHASSWKRLADDAEQSGDVRQQIDYLRRYTAMRRSDAPAFEKLGELLIEINQPWQSHLPLATALTLYEGGEGGAADILRVRRTFIDAALLTGRWTDAELHLQKLIDSDSEGQPDQAEYHEQLARCRLETARWSEAKAELELAIEHDPSRCSSYAMLANLEVFRLEQPSDAVNLLNRLVAENPDDAEAFQTRAGFRLLYQNNESVRRAVSAAATSGSNDGTSTTLTGDEAARLPFTPQEMVELANADAVQALQLAPDDRAVLGLAMACANQLSEMVTAEQANAYRADARRHAEAIIASCKAEAVELGLIAPADRRKTAETAPNDPDSTDNTAVTQSDETTAAYSREIRRIYAEAVPAINVLASLSMSEGDLAGAMAVLADGLEKAGSEKSLLVNLASLKISQSQAADEQDEIDRLLRTLQKLPESGPLVAYLDARRSMGRGEWRKAADELEAVQPQLAGWASSAVEAELAIALCRMRLGQPQRAEAIYRRIVEENPFVIPARWGLATALDAQGKRSEAYPHYQFIVSRAKIVPGDAGYEDLAFRTVRAMIEHYAGQDPDSQGWASVETFIQKTRAAVIEAGGGSAQLANLDIMEAELLVARKRLDAADDVLSAAVERDPQSANGWFALVALRDLREDWDRAEAALGAASAAIVADDEVRDIQLKLAEALHHVRRLSATLSHSESSDRGVTLEQTKEFVGQLVASVPDLNTDDRTRRLDYNRAKSGLAQITHWLGDSQTAERLYREIADSDENDLQARFALMDLALRSGSADDIASILDEIKGVEGNEGPMWNFGEAIRLSLSNAQGENLRKDLARAEEHLQVPARAWLGSNRVRLVHSHIYRRQGRIAEAVEIDLQSFRNGYATPEFIGQLAKDLYSLKKYEDAASVLSRVKDNAPASLANLAPTAMAVSGIVRDDEQSQQLRSLAISLARSGADDSQDYRVKLAYGLMLVQNDDPVAARQAFEAARDLSPESPEPWLLLIDLDVRAGEIENARQTIEQAAVSIRAADREYALARGYQALNEPELSRMHLEQALASMPDDLKLATAGQIEILEGAADAYLTRAQQERTQARKIAAESPEAAREQQAAAAAFEATGIQLLDRLIEEGSRALTDLITATDNSDEGLQTKERLATSVPRARRRLALLTFGKGGARNRERAERLISANRVRTGFLPEDARLYAIVLSQSPARADKLKALTELEILIRESDDPQSQDMLLASTLHLSEYRHFKAQSESQRDINRQASANLDTTAQQHLADARELMNGVLVADRAYVSSGSEAATLPPNYVPALLGMIDILLINNEVQEAAFYVQQLNSAAPGTQAAANATANVHFAKGEHGSAIDAIRQFATVGSEGELDSRRLTSIQILEGFGKRAEDDEAANAYYAAAEEQVSAVGPDEQRRLLMAAIQAQRGNAAQAIDLIESVAATAPDNQFASACVLALRAAGHDADLLRRLIATLQNSLDAHPASVVIQLTIADIHSWLGEMDRSESYYRDVLTTNSKHAAAANNLAFLLASQGRNLDEAVDLINGVIAEQGPLPELLDTRAYVLLKRGTPGDADQAKDDLEKALESGQSPGYLFHLTQAYLAKNRSVEAAGAWLQAVAAGLTEQQVHPLELQDYRRLKSQIASQ